MFIILFLCEEIDVYCCDYIHIFKYKKRDLIKTYFKCYLLHPKFHPLLK